MWSMQPIFPQENQILEVLSCESESRIGLCLQRTGVAYEGMRALYPLWTASSLPPVAGAMLASLQVNHSWHPSDRCLRGWIRRNVV